MFLDVLSPKFKDYTIYIFVAFSFFVCIAVIILNGNVHWWEDNCSKPLPADHDDKGPFDFAVVVSSIYIGVISLICLYAIVKTLFENQDDIRAAMPRIRRN